MSRFTNSRQAVTLIICSLLFLSAWINSPTLSQTADSSCSLKIVYPKSGSTIGASSTFIVGQVTPSSILTCNGNPVKVNKSGFYAHVVPLQFGNNHFVLSAINRNSFQNTNSTYDSTNNTYTKTNSTANSTSTSEEEITIYRKSPPKPIGANEIKLIDLSPNADLGVRAGDVINFTAHATPGSKVIVQFGEHELSLLPYKGKYGNSNSPEVAYGKVVHSEPVNISSKDSDVYKGSYRVTENDHFAGVHPKYTLISGSRNLSEASKGTINTVERFIAARTAKAPTVVRIAPNLARTTPLVEDVGIIIDGWSGDNMRCLYSSNRHVWIKRTDLVIDDNAATARSQDQTNRPVNTAPQAVARTINLASNQYGEQMRLPLTERLPYQIEQKLNPNCLILRLYGVSSDTDWITNEPNLGAQDKQVIDNVTWRQPEDNVYEITVHLLGHRQWGYKIFYEGSTLCLDVKRNPSTVRTEGDTRLEGIKICLDPGHGGSENGSIGCSGLPESQLNFDIAMQTKTCLENLGAIVIMTRNSANETVSLDQRVKIATDSQSDFLISIHNNALPDGRDPWQEHGTSSYWYHPQSIELARYLKNAVKEVTAFPDLGARYQNLALARTQAMPSVLLEIGFMINPDEFAQLIDPQVQAKIARAVANGLIEYLNPGKGEERTRAQ